MKSKWLEKTGKIAGFSVLGLILLLILLGGILHTSPVQRFIARKAAGFATEFMDCDMRVGKLDFNLFKRTATLRNVEIFDCRDNRTVFIAEAMVTLKNYNFQTPTLSSIALYDPQIDIIRYEGDSMSDFNRVVKKIAALPKKDTALRKAFVIERGRIFNGSFTYNDRLGKYAPDGVIDYKHVALECVYAEASDFYSRCGKVLFRVKHIECNEKWGFRVEDCSAWGCVDVGRLRFSDVNIKTPQSTLALNYYLEAEDWPAYKDFINNVRMEADVSPSELMLSDLRYFTPVFKNMAQKVTVNGHVEGLVRDLNLEDLKIHTGKRTSLNADVNLVGLPRMQAGHVDVRLHQMNVEAADLNRLVLPDGNVLALPPALQSLQTARVDGFFRGDLHQFSTEVNIQTNLGNVYIGNTAKDTADGQNVTTGHISAHDIRMDKLLQQDSLLGKVAVESEFRLSGSGKDNTLCHFKGEVIDFEIDRKVLRAIPFHIDWRKDLLRVDLSCADTNLDFDLKGQWNKSRDSSWLVCELDMRNVDLQPLRLFGDTGRFTLKTHLTANNIAYKKESIQGFLRMENTEIVRLGSVYRLDYLHADLERRDSVERILNLRSDQVEAELVGRWHFLDLKGAFLNTIRENLPHLGHYLSRYTDEESLKNGNRPQDFDLRLRLNGADRLLGVVYPDLSLPLGLKMNLRYASESNRGRLQMAMPYVQQGSLAYLNGYADVVFNGAQLQLETTADRFYLDDSMSMNGFAVKVSKADTNAVAYRLSWGRDGNLLQNTYGNFAGMFHFLPNGKMRLELQDFNLQTGKETWKSYSDGYILFGPRLLDMHHVGMFSTRTSDGISMEGTVSPDSNSVLKVQFNDFDLSYLEFFLRKVPMKIETFIDGEAQLRDFYGDFSFHAGLRMKDVSINGTPYGQGYLRAFFNKEKVVHASFNLLQEVRQRRQNTSKKLFSIEGDFYPADGQKLDFKGVADAFPINFLDKLMASVAEDLAGTVNGKLRIAGSLKHPELYVDAVGKDLGLTISMLHTRYLFETLPIRLTPTEIDFSPSPFIDEVFKTRGKFGGRITHRQFKDIHLGLDVEFGNMLALRTSREADLPFWGTVFATGILDVEGPVNNIFLKVNAQVQDNSDIFFDFSNPTGGSGANFITFKTQDVAVVDSGRMSLEKYYARRRAAAIQKGKIKIDLNMDITPGLAVSVRLRNAAMDGHLTATGKGVLRFHMENEEPQLFGTYTINGGGFDFSMVNLINKKFKLKEGGTVSWLGDVSDPRVNVLAGYQTKASLYPVLASFDPSNDGRYKQKVNVESIIALSGNMLNPDISFDIDLLNADDDTKDKFWALVRKNNEDEMLQQTFSLLMFNSFMAVESGSSSSVGSSALASSSELLFSQFNNFLSRLSNDFNIGINYKPGSTTSNSEFQVMMSGQLFDDRLVINGNLGVADNMAGTGSSNATVVGDVDVEWKFTEELRLRGFNHSNDEDLTKPVNSYTQGVGIVFRRDFDNLNEFLHGTGPRLTKEERKANRRKTREIRRKKRFER